jgi:hypothetical protein
MKKTDIAYIAGFFDGEGCVRIARQKKSYRVRVGFTNNDLTLLTWVQSILGGRLYQKKRASVRHAQGWELLLTKNAEIELALRHLLPFIKIKRKQAELSLSLLLMGKMKKVSLGARGKTWPIMSVAPGEVEKRELITTRVTELNKRGPHAGSK